MTRPPSPAPSPIQRHNYAAVQADSVFLGIVSASGTFLPVFLLRLGASGTAIGLLTAIPALTALVIAIPFGRWLQRRRNIVPWYSRLRLVAWLSYAVMAGVAAILPPADAVPAMLVVWALASLPSTAALVAFPIIMSGAAGPSGRFDLLGRRWAIAGASTTISVALGGQLLNLLAFPTNFELLFVGITVAGFGSFLQSSRIVIPDQPPVAVTSGQTAVARLPGITSLVRSRRPFVRYELQSLVYTVGIGIAAPLLPLFYVHEVGAPDAWIGIIGAAQSAGGVVGYLAARRLSIRRSGVSVLLPSLLLVAIVPLTQAALGWLPAVAAVAFLYGLGGAGAQLAMFDLLMRRIPSEHGVTFSSVDQTVQNLGFILAPNIGGLLAVTIGVRLGLAVAAAVLGLAFAWFAIDRSASSEARSTSQPPAEPKVVEPGGEVNIEQPA
ncbi:MAG TPA: MFS transporter [Candidatus Limnocylindrales bacterium]|nr:MFS transporter [Candidatus Limnocylindrales bacterium]